MQEILTFSDIPKIDGNILRKYKFKNNDFKIVDHNVQDNEVKDGQIILSNMLKVSMVKGYSNQWCIFIEDESKTRDESIFRALKLVKDLKDHKNKTIIVAAYSPYDIVLNIKEKENDSEIDYRLNNSELKFRSGRNIGFANIKISELIKALKLNPESSLEELLGDVSQL